MRGLFFIFWLFWCNAAFGSAVSVVYFDTSSLNTGLQPLGRGIADMLLSDLVASGVPVVERARLAEVMKELEVHPRTVVDGRTALRVGKGVGASAIITGSMFSMGEQLRIDARIVSIKDGMVLGIADASGPLQDIAAVEHALALELLSHLQPDGTAPSPHPASLEAVLALGRALDAVNQGEVDHAHLHLKIALKSEDFEPAKRMMERLQAKVEPVLRAREEFHLKRLDQATMWIEPCEKSADACGDLAAFVHIFGVPQSNPAVAHDCQAFLKKVAASMISPDVRHRDGLTKGMPTVELATYRLIRSYRLTENHAEVIAWGATFAERYPTNTYIFAVKADVDASMAALER